MKISVVFKFANWWVDVSQKILRLARGKERVIKEFL